MSQKELVMGFEAYDVGKRQDDFKALLEAVAEYAFADKIDGLCFIIRGKEGDVVHWHLTGTASPLEWVGVLEGMKNYYLAMAEA